MSNAFGEGLAIDSEALEVGTAGVGGEGEKVDAFFAGIVEEGLEGVIAHEGIEGDGVSTQVFITRNGIAALSFTDVGALGIDDDGDVSGDELNDPFEEGDALAAECFKVGAVRFEGGSVG